jgi:hypothetical protein
MDDDITQLQCMLGTWGYTLKLRNTHRHFVLQQRLHERLLSVILTLPALSRSYLVQSVEPHTRV